MFNLTRKDKASFQGEFHKNNVAAVIHIFHIFLQKKILCGIFLV